MNIDNNFFAYGKSGYKNNEFIDYEDLPDMFDWNNKSENSISFKSHILNKIKPLYDNFPNIFQEKTKKIIDPLSIELNEYPNLYYFSTEITQYGSDFYMRKLNIDDEELLLYVSPDFVNKILIETNETKDNFIKKTLANHFIFAPFINELIKNTSINISSEDMGLKNSTYIPYAKPVKPNIKDFCNTNINLTSGPIRNLLSIELKYKYKNIEGLLIIAGTKKPWLKYFQEKDAPEYVNLEEMKTHNCYSIISSFNLCEEDISKLKVGDTFLIQKYFYESRLPLIHHGKKLVEGLITVDKFDKLGLVTSYKKFTRQESDYFNNTQDNLFVILGSTYIREADLKTFAEGDYTNLNTTVTGLFPLAYNNKIIAQVEISNYYNFPLIKISKIETNPIPFQL